MERTYWFRGKSTGVLNKAKPGQWVFGSLVVKNDMYIIVSLDDSVNIVNPKTVGQFTGKIDEDDKYIYEGDKVYDGVACFYSVDFDKDNCSFYLSFDNGMDSERLDEYNNGVLKIIGNIHDK